jgi:hypothetical protein
MLGSILSEFALANGAVQTYVPMAPCVPTNQLLVTPMSGVINTISGALGGLLFGIVVVFLVVLALLAVVTVLTKSAPKYLRAMALVALIPIGLILLVITYHAIVVGLNNNC